MGLRLDHGVSLARLSLSGRSTLDHVDRFVPRDFDISRRLETPQLVLEALGAEHNDRAAPIAVDDALKADPGVPTFLA